MKNLDIELNESGTRIGRAELRRAIEKAVDESTTCTTQRYTVECCEWSVFAAWGFRVGTDVMILILKIK